MHIILLGMCKLLVVFTMLVRPHLKLSHPSWVHLFQEMLHQILIMSLGFLALAFHLLVLGLLPMRRN
uniref:Uncharacterized protein n=1 Tax=Arundo donax TaxID=35708 RepID=A0A0A9CK18_ARUDO